MNYLELVQEIVALTRIGQGEIGEEPATVAGATGKLGECARFARRAWIDIQNSRTGWRFMRRFGTLTLPQSQSIVQTSAIPDFSLLSTSDDGRGRFITINGETPDEQIVRFIPWQFWQQSYLQRGPRGVGTPANFTLRPDSSIEFDLEADMPYTVRLWYKRSPQSLQVDTDVPIMPERFHMAIVWWAIAHYYCATRDDAAKKYENAARNLRRELMQLNNEQLDEYFMIEAGQ